MKKIILGSNSPRRKELLAGLDIDFTVDTGNTFEENIDKEIPADKIPVFMSEGKSRGFHRPLNEDEVLITADTVVIVQDKGEKQVLGKPHDRQSAIDMLKLLSGRSHEVITAVTLRIIDKEISFSDSTTVHFEALSNEEIEYYVDKFKPFDKAGAYGIQEWIGYAAISSIEGSFYNVMGLPVHKLYRELLKFI